MKYKSQCSMRDSNTWNTSNHSNNSNYVIHFVGSDEVPMMVIHPLLAFLQARILMITWKFVSEKNQNKMYFAPLAVFLFQTFSSSLGSSAHFLNEATFTNSIVKIHHFVLFYAPWYVNNIVCYLNLFFEFDN